MDEKRTAVLRLVAAGMDIVDACRLCGFLDPEVASLELMGDESFVAGLDATVDPRSDVLVQSNVARKRFWARVVADDNHPIKDRLRASELLSKSSGDFTEKIEVSFSPKRLLEALNDGD